MPFLKTALILFPGLPAFFIFVLSLIILGLKLNKKLAARCIRRRLQSAQNQCPGIHTRRHEEIGFIMLGSPASLLFRESDSALCCVLLCRNDYPLLPAPHLQSCPKIIKTTVGLHAPQICYKSAHAALQRKQ